MSAIQILLIGEDEIFAGNATLTLINAGYTVINATNSIEGQKIIMETLPDIIVMDQTFPVGDNEDTCMRLRQSTDLPIMIVGNPEDTAEILEMGMDSFIDRKYFFDELVPRVKGVLRRNRYMMRKNNPVSELADFLRSSNVYTIGDGRVYEEDRLCMAEYRLAACLLLHKGRLLEYQRLIDEVWGGKTISIDTLHHYMNSLRKKLRDYVTREEIIINHRGIGYYLGTLPAYSEN